jgi:hypothetical protein
MSCCSCTFRENGIVTSVTAVSPAARFVAQDTIPPPWARQASRRGRRWHWASGLVSRAVVAHRKRSAQLTARPSVTQRARATHARHAVHVAYDTGGTTGRRLSAFGLPSGRADAPLGRPAARAGAGAGPLRSSRLARLCWVGWCGKGGRGSPTLYVRLLWVPRDGRGRRGVRYADRPESVRESTQSTRGLVICSDPNWPALRQSRCAESRCRYARGVSPSPGADVARSEPQPRRRLRSDSALAA